MMPDAPGNYLDAPCFVVSADTMVRHDFASERSLEAFVVRCPHQRVFWARGYAYCTECYALPNLTRVCT